MTETATELPSTFRDAQDREWEPRLDYVKVRKIRDAMPKIDLGSIERMGETWATLLSDDLKALDTIWLSIADDAGELAGDGSGPAGGVTKDDWLASMDGELLEAARAALKTAIQNFTSPAKRKLLQQGLGAVDKAYRMAIGQAELRVEAEMDKAIEKALAATAPGLQPPATTAGRSNKRTKR